MNIVDVLRDPTVHHLELLADYHDVKEVVLVEGVVGIPRKHLQKEFSKIRNDYTGLIRQMHDTDNTSSEGKRGNNRLWDLTTIALIITTENLTAINTRKRLLLSGSVTSSYQDEMRFLDILFSSPLHKHTKSPMLWHHRLWISQKMETGLDLKHEFNIVFRAAELHPKNYYAWTYARRLVWSYHPNLEELSATVYDFCSQHTTDISGWSFLEFVLRTNGNYYSYNMKAKELYALSPNEAIEWFIQWTS